MALFSAIFEAWNAHRPSGHGIMHIQRARHQPLETPVACAMQVFASDAHAAGVTELGEGCSIGVLSALAGRPKVLRMCDVIFLDHVHVRGI